MTMTTERLCEMCWETRATLTLEPKGERCCGPCARTLDEYRFGSVTVALGMMGHAVIEALGGGATHHQVRAAVEAVLARAESGNRDDDVAAAAGRDGFDLEWLHATWQPVEPAVA